MMHRKLRSTLRPSCSRGAAHQQRTTLPYQYIAAAGGRRRYYSAAGAAYLCCQCVVAVALYGCGVEHDLNNLLGKLTHTCIWHITLEGVWLAPPVDQLPAAACKTCRMRAQHMMGVNGCSLESKQAEEPMPSTVTAHLGNLFV